MRNHSVMMKQNLTRALATTLLLGAYSASASTSTSTMTMDMSGGTMNMDTARMQGGSAPADARDPNAYSDGLTLHSGAYALPGIQRPSMGDEHSFWAVAFNRFEAVKADDGDYGVYDAEAWFGRTYDRAVLKSEGDVVDDTLEESSTDLLYSHAVTAYWDLQTGLRHDSAEGPDRNWLALGFEGLAPYWFEVNATVYLGEQGRSLLKVDAEYEVLLSQRLILQPRMELAAYGRDDVQNGLGSGLSSIDVGLRLRYEISRQFAPYLGVEWKGQFGDTADYTRADGGDPNEVVLVGGVRFWF